MCFAKKYQFAHPHPQAKNRQLLRLRRGIATPSIRCVCNIRDVADFAELTPPTRAISFI
jgi:hypothetical protein